jgi:hypothetical protein
MSLPIDTNRLKRFIHEAFHEIAKEKDLYPVIIDLVSVIINKWENFKDEFFGVNFNTVLELEGLSDWTYKITSGGGLCLYDKKELWILPDNFALFLHEVAHALCPKEKCGICWVETNNGHNAIWGDTFTNLVNKYM